MIMFFCSSVERKMTWMLNFAYLFVLEPDYFSFFFWYFFFCFKQKLTSFSFFSFRKQDIIRHLHFWMNFAFKLMLLLVTQTTLNWSKFRNLTMLKYAFDVSVVNCKKKENLEWMKNIFRWPT